MKTGRPGPGRVKLTAVAACPQAEAEARRRCTEKSWRQDRPRQACGKADDVTAREDEGFIGAQEVAELLDMNVQMVRKYAREGRLPAYRLPGGRTFKFLRSELQQEIRRHPVVKGV